ncbi:hypothetical protein TGGT1_203560 [Toxoplasma gondii GT1]|uniref:Uncharacterized protein n=2 Tax=Toxoplasma gondii TaxID=5811 RepID=S7UVV7_TOXGG|nr:hypothetical protein TGGT1_203560 [Toxoplasma gondii GT1]KFG39364.1 hypothetical protein TGFOU_203560 [Toxoplasma gondii FOU]
MGVARHLPTPRYEALLRFRFLTAFILSGKPHHSTSFFAKCFSCVFWLVVCSAQPLWASWRRMTGLGRDHLAPWPLLLGRHATISYAVDVLVVRQPLTSEHLHVYVRSAVSRCALNPNANHFCFGLQRGVLSPWGNNSDYYLNVQSQSID